MSKAIEALLEKAKKKLMLFTDTTSVRTSANGQAIECIDKALALLRAGGETPKGYVLVPKKPTEEMLMAGCTMYASEFGFSDARAVYKAMIAAAPPPPQQETET